MSSLAGPRRLVFLFLSMWPPSGACSLAPGSCGQCGIFGPPSSVGSGHIMIHRTKMQSAPLMADPSMNEG